MYKEILNYFENECCISNIFMKKHWIAWYLTLITVFIVGFVFWYIDNVYIRILVIFFVDFLILGSLLITYIKLLYEELTKELDIKGLQFDLKSLFTKEKRISAYYEFQNKKVKNYCINKNISPKHINTFLKYVDEDLAHKYPANKVRDYFMGCIIPSIISIIAVYLTNNNIQKLDNIIGFTITAIIITWIFTLSINSFFQIRFLMVNPRRNLIEFKDILRNINLKDKEQ